MGKETRIIIGCILAGIPISFSVIYWGFYVVENLANQIYAPGVLTLFIIFIIGLLFIKSGLN